MAVPFIPSLLRPRSTNEDAQRREFILNILLLSSILFFSAASVISFFAFLLRPASSVHNSVPLLLLLSTVAFLLFLYFLSRKGLFRIAAYTLVGIFFLFALLMGYRWGIDLSASLLLYSLVIVMAGVLVSTRFAFLSAAIITFSLLVIGQLQVTGAIHVDRYWRTESWHTSDIVMTMVILLAVATVSWLSNREIERSLHRAQASEEALRIERDSLEVTVEERTKELKQSQMERISQLYRFAEFGRLSSGLFHDLMNPLTAVSVNLESAAFGHGNGGKVTEAQDHLGEALKAAQRMERFIGAIRKQIGKESDRVLFSLTDEAKDVLEILSYKAHKARVALHLIAPKPIAAMGDPVRWSQAILNLVTNGIDAYDHDLEAKYPREVTVTLNHTDAGITCIISDHGCGISEQEKERIFEPFFTTKAGDLTRGTGIGLSMVKQIIEDDFQGTITFTSSPEQGTIFTISIPLS